MSGFRNGNVGGGELVAGGCWRSVGLVWFGSSIVDLKVVMPLHAPRGLVIDRFHMFIIILGSAALWRISRRDP